MTIHFDGVAFTDVLYDPQDDYLSLRVSPGAVSVYGDESDEWHAVKYDAAGNIVGIVVNSAMGWLERDGDIALTMSDGHVMRSPDVAIYLRSITAEKTAA